MDKYRVAVIGATGLVGRTLIKMLASHPFFELDGVYASESSRGYSISNISPSYVKNPIAGGSDLKHVSFSIEGPEYFRGLIYHLALSFSAPSLKRMLH